VDGFSHLVDAVEGEIKHSGVGKPVLCYVEESSLPAGVYREILELVINDFHKYRCSEIICINLSVVIFIIITVSEI